MLLAPVAQPAGGARGATPGAPCPGQLGRRGGDGSARPALPSLPPFPAHGGAKAGETQEPSPAGWRKRKFRHRDVGGGFFHSLPRVTLEHVVVVKRHSAGRGITSRNRKRFPSEGGVWSKQEIQLIAVDKPREYRIAALLTSETPQWSRKRRLSNTLAPSTQIMSHLLPAASKPMSWLTKQQFHEKLLPSWILFSIG